MHDREYLVLDTNDLCAKDAPGKEMANADVSRVGESHCISLIGIDQMLMTD